MRETAAVPFALTASGDIFDDMLVEPGFTAGSDGPSHYHSLRRLLVLSSPRAVIIDGLVWSAFSLLFFPLQEPLQFARSHAKR